MVGGEVDPIGFAEARSALVWWLEAGVDAIVDESPRSWLDTPGAKSHLSLASETAPAGNLTYPAHQTLAELQQWLASSMHLPLASPGAKRVLPEGPQDPEVMLLTDAPTFEDYATGQPIGGDAWELTKRMLAAIKVPVEQAYFAPLNCVHVPGAKMSPAERETCAEIARQHIKLARPMRLLLLGDGPAQALLGKPVIHARGHIHKVEGVRTVATFHPRALIKQASNKELAWKDLLLLMEEDS